MKKRFGQNLLVDNIYINKILQHIDVSSDESVLEIGSGSGLLTEPLSRKVKKIYAVEFERDIVKSLRESVALGKLENVEIIQDDILRVQIEKLSEEKLIIVGNIPYNITSKIIIKLLGEIDFPSVSLSKTKKIYLMVQKEVGERIAARHSTKAYSPLTLLVNFFAESRILFDVPPQAFHPRPKITSCFIEITPRDEMLMVSNPAKLKEIIRTVFQQRRKKLINPLSNIVEDKGKIRNVLQSLNIDENARAENLTLEQYIKMTDLILE